MNLWKNRLIDEIKEMRKDIKYLCDTMHDLHSKKRDSIMESLRKENENLKYQLKRQTEFVHQVILHEYEKDLKENQFEAVVLIPYGEKAIVFKHGKPMDTSQAYRVTLDYEANNSSCEINLYSE